MAPLRPLYSGKEFRRRGEAIYERDIKPHYEPEHHGEYVAIDIESGEFEVRPTELDAVDALRARLPRAQIWMRRVGIPYVRRLGYAAAPKT